jgi:parallel beta-helix repeat protein
MLRENFKKISNMLILIIVIIMVIPPIHGLPDNSKGIIYVDDDADPAWYDATHVKTIQEGIDNATIDDTVYLYDGIYFENIFINYTLDLRGENRFNTIIDGGSKGSVINISAEHVLITNLTIQHGGEGCSPEKFAGINILQGNNTIFNTTIRRNSNFGFSVNSSNNIIKNNIVYGNCGEGIYLTENSTNNLIFSNIFQDFAIDHGVNQWNISQTPGQNIIGTNYLGGNYWGNYIGRDLNEDGIGDTQIPHTSNGNIMVGGDYLPLTDVLVQDQSISDRGFPIRHATDGDWGAAQNFTLNHDILSRAKIYLRKFGTPEFNLTIQIREETPEDGLFYIITFQPDEISTDWQWVDIEFKDLIIDHNKNYIIVVPPAPSNVSTSFGYEWGYAFGDIFKLGAFWFTRNSGSLWRALPSTYDFAFRAFGLNID